MLNCNKNIIAVLCCCTFIFYGCIESKYPLNITSTLNERPESFLQQLPGIGKMKYAGMTVKQKATTVEVYAASFKEMNIEKVSALWTLVLYLMLGLVPLYLR